MSVAGALVSLSSLKFYRALSCFFYPILTEKMSYFSNELEIQDSRRSTTFLVNFLSVDGKKRISIERYHSQNWIWEDSKVVTLIWNDYI